MTLSPRDFIRPPFRRCPRCGAPSYGIRVVARENYGRACKQCLYRGAAIPLPELDKKVIYLDQFVISNMMKASNPNTKAHRRGTLDPFYADLFERLKRLARMQLIVCPSSFTHQWESLASPFFKALEACYETLSYGVKFYDPSSIRRFQLIEHARNWIRDEPDKPLTLDVHSLVTSSINVWPPDFHVKVNLNYGEDVVDEIVKWRNEGHQGLCAVFGRWMSEKNRTFKDWFTEEAMAFGETALKVYKDHFVFALKSLIQEAVLGGSQLLLGHILAEPPELYTNVQVIRHEFREAGIREDQVLSKVREYFLSPHLKDVPFIKIQSMLYAALARKAAAGQKRPPNRGMANDIEILSLLLPFCDAMFVDKECHALLREKPLCTEINYGTRVFSLNNKQDFLDYLADIEKSASPELLAALAELHENR
jgi:hypothetical protein